MPPLPSAVAAHPLCAEVAAAIEIVTRACELARSVQSAYCGSGGGGGGGGGGGTDCESGSGARRATTIAKAEASPVTIADFAVQALVLDHLHRAFPDDVFIAEETSAQLRGQDDVVAQVRNHLQRVTTPTSPLSTAKTAVRGGTGDDAQLASAAGTPWSAHDVCAAVDLGGDAGGHTGRTWILDPVDGTKGFLRNEQFCIALALVQRGHVQLGVLGCPNLSPSRSTEHVPLASDSARDSAPAGRDGVSSFTVANAADGSVFYAARGSGAYMQPATLAAAANRADAVAVPGDSATPARRAERVRVSTVAEPSWAPIAESVESAHSSHDLSRRIAAILGTQRRLRVDSQCKYGMLARGEAAVFLRFPHAGYEENVWDHAAGDIVLREAGGTVTDAVGNALDFAHGRRLHNAAGIVATNGVLHPAVLAAVRHVLEERERDADDAPS